MRHAFRFTSARPALVLAAASTVVLAACSKPQPPAPPPKPVRAMPVVLTTDHDGASFTGAVRARVESDLAFRVGGKVVRRHVEVGERVKAGDPIATLDAADYDLGLQAALAQQQAASVDAAQAAADAERFARLLADGAMSAGDVERQRARADAARERLTQAQRQVELARNRASYAVLRAPFAGVVTQLRVEAGQVVAEGQPVAGLAADGEREIVVDVPESRIAQLRTASASASLWSGGGERFPVALREVSPVAAPGTRTYRARYRVVERVVERRGEATADALRLGMTATVWLDAGPGTHGKSAAPVALLPASALHHRDGQPAVWTIDRSSGAPARVPVTVVRFGQDEVAVTGLASGQWVATAGVQKLAEGMRVAAVSEDGRALADAGAPAAAPVAAHVAVPSTASTNPQIATAAR